MPLWILIRVFLSMGTKPDLYNWRLIFYCWMFEQTRDLLSLPALHAIPQRLALEKRDGWPWSRGILDHKLPTWKIDAAAQFPLNHFQKLSTFIYRNLLRPFQDPFSLPSESHSLAHPWVWSQWPSANSAWLTPYRGHFMLQLPLLYASRPSVITLKNRAWSLNWVWMKPG